jgi:hypothetical protein
VRKSRERLGDDSVSALRATFTQSLGRPRALRSFAEWRARPQLQQAPLLLATFWFFDRKNRLAPRVVEL